MDDPGAPGDAGESFLKKGEVTVALPVGGAHAFGPGQQPGFSQPQMYGQQVLPTQATESEYAQQHAQQYAQQYAQHQYAQQQYGPQYAVPGYQQGG